MKMLTRLTWGSAKFWLGAVIVVVAALAVTRDSTPTNAVNPEILPSLSGSSPAYSASALLVKGGHFSFNAPCIGDTDPTTLCLRIWAKGVNNSTGASAFQAHYTYPADQLTVSTVSASTTWLGSTGRSVTCPAGSSTLGDGTLRCLTMLAPPPFGATGDGLLASIAIESTDVTGVASFTLAPDTQLLDTPPNPDDITTIPATIRSINIVVAPCADFDGNGRVTVADVIYVVQHFHTSDPPADLDGSGSVTAADIILSVKEFAMLCTR